MIDPVLALAALQVSFAPPVDVVGGPDEHQLAATADLDADGRDDVLLFGGEAVGVTVHLSVGAGFDFDPGRALAEDLGQVQHVVTADLDADGDVDVVAVGHDGGQFVLAIFLNEGGALVRLAPQGLPGPAGASAEFAAGDLDGDGFPDLVSAIDGVASVRPWTGAGFAAQAHVLAVDAELGKDSVADIDGDGHADFAYIDTAAAVIGGVPLVRLGGTASGTPFGLGAPQPLLDLAPGVHVFDFVLGDVDGDGLLDGGFVLATNFRVTLGLQRPGAGAALMELQPVPNPELVFSKVAGFHDVDGDGNLDLVAGVPREDDPFTPLTQPFGSLLLGDGTGALTQSAGVVRGTGGDLDGDGRRDWIDAAGVPVITVNNSSPQAVDLSGRRWFEPHFLEAGDVVVADVNGDGLEDVVVSTFVGAGVTRTSPVTVHLGRGGLAFERGIPVFEDMPTLFEGRNVAVGDFDGDGTSDIAFQYEVGSTGELRTAFGDGVGGFQQAPPVNASGVPVAHRMQAADLNGDGMDDLLVAGRNALWGPVFELHVLYSQGDGSFTALEIGLPSESEFGARAVDYTGDGRLDVLFGTPSELLLQRQRSDGTLAPPEVVGAFDTGQPTDVAVATGDLNADGFPDLFVRANAVGLISGGTGAGEYRPFAAATPVALTHGAYADLVDVDADGDLDAVLNTRDFVPFVHSSVEPPLELTALLNGGIGLFPDALSLTGAIPGDVRIARFADMDGDGDEDLVVVTGDWARLQVLENLAVASAGTTFCGPAASNSSGRPARMLAYGEPVPGGQQIRLTAVDLPDQQFGFFVGSRTAAAPFPVSNSQGRLCLGGSIGRYVAPGQVQSSGTAGSFSILVDPGALVEGGSFVPASAGESWHFQAWFRDVQATAQGPQPTSNFTDGIRLDF